MPSLAEVNEMLLEMSPENYKAVVGIIVRIYDSDKNAQMRKERRMQEKKDAFLDLENLRKELKGTFDRDFDYKKELEEALEEKYGRVD